MVSHWTTSQTVAGCAWVPIQLPLTSQSQQLAGYLDKPEQLQNLGALMCQGVLKTKVEPSQSQKPECLEKVFLLFQSCRSVKQSILISLEKYHALENLFKPSIGNNDDREVTYLLLFTSPL